MKKCAIVYTRGDGKEFWSSSTDDRGCTYCLVPRETEIPTHKDASEFYGKNRKEWAQRRIDRDHKYRRFIGYTVKIIEYDREPEWYFEIRHELSHCFGDYEYHEVRKHFPLDPHKDYKLWPGHDRPFITDLDLDELERYYAWRKQHYKGKTRE